MQHCDWSSDVCSSDLCVLYNLYPSGPARIAKTLSFQGEDENHCILIVTAGDAKIDNSKFRHFFKMKARMLSPEKVAESTMLIYFELSGSSIMENNIFGVTYAIRQSLIRDVYSIISCFRNIGYPLGKGFIFFLFGRGKTCGTTDERIFTIPVNLFSPGDRKSTRLNSSHNVASRMPSSA